MVYCLVSAFHIFIAILYIDNDDIPNFFDFDLDLLSNNNNNNNKSISYDPISSISHFPSSSELETSSAFSSLLKSNSTTENTTNSDLQIQHNRATTSCQELIDIEQDFGRSSTVVADKDFIVNTVNDNILIAQVSDPSMIF